MTKIHSANYGSERLRLQWSILDSSLINRLIFDTRPKKNNVVFVGGGGGAAALIPFVARTLKMNYEISDNAEVISSIGVSLAMARDIVERTIPMPTSEDILRIKNEAREAAIRSGALPESAEIHVEVDPYTQRVRAIAIGATEMRAQDLTKRISPEETEQVAGATLGLKANDLLHIGSTGSVNVFAAKVAIKKLGLLSSVRQPPIVIDREGIVKFRTNDAYVLQSSVRHALEDVDSGGPVSEKYKVNTFKLGPFRVKSENSCS